MNKANGTSPLPPSQGGFFALCSNKMSSWTSFRMTISFPFSLSISQLFFEGVILFQQLVISIQQMLGCHEGSLLTIQHLLFLGMKHRLDGRIVIEAVA